MTNRFTHPQIVAGMILFLLSSSAAQERILIDLKLNGQDARFALDTGSDGTVLFARSAKRLKLAFSPPSDDLDLPPGTVPAGVTEKCRVEIGGQVTEGKLSVIEIDPRIVAHIDGVFSWRHVSDAVFSINAVGKEVHALEKLPGDIGTWSQWPIYSDSQQLAIKASERSGDESTAMIDTGLDSGVQLSAELWAKWRGAQEAPPRTLEAKYFPGVGLKVNEVCWAESISVGDLLLRGVTVAVAPAGHEAWFENYHATIGLTALKQLAVVVDAKNGHVYTRPLPGSKVALRYNRLGAVFVPGGSSRGDLVAHVIEGGPAHKHGVRDGDKLLKIGELDVINWRKDPGVLPLSRFWNAPAGTELDLLIERGGLTKEITVKLEEIFPRPNG